MILEHQSEAYNLLTKANFVTQELRSRGKNAELDEEARDKVRDAVRPLVEHLCFLDEFPLSHPVSGNESFRSYFEGVRHATEFTQPIRQLDMQTRMFRSPVSYLLHAETFELIDTELQSAIAKGIETCMLAQGVEDSQWRSVVPAWFEGKARRDQKRKPESAKTPAP